MIGTWTPSEAFKVISDWGPSFGVLPTLLIMAIAFSKGHDKYAIIGFAVVCFTSVYAITHSLEFVLWKWAGDEAVRPPKEMMVGAVALMVSSICTICSCFASAWKRKK